ncbi:hypothetical protein GS501_00935, partial [Saccharibacter sp. 17.LH.SD]|uniref:endonuclease toxin domain-containing protein n=1 Tax=Saccharibacter sp. 17.LH.SD TaxID=2689393 RepID=UPI00137149C5
SQGLEGHEVVDKMFQSLELGKPDARQYGVFQEELARGNTPEEIRKYASQGLEGHEVVDKMFQSLELGKPDARQYGVFQEELARGNTPEEIRKYASQGLEGHEVVDKIFRGFGLDKPGNFDTYLQKLGAGYSIQDIRGEIAVSPEAMKNWQGVYSSWESTPATQLQLRVIADSVVQLDQSWSVVEHQTMMQLQHEARAYQAISGTAGYMQIDESIAVSSQEATALLANAVLNPMMNNIPDSASLQQIMGNQPVVAIKALVDEADVLNNEHDIEQKETLCDNWQAFKAEHSENVSNAAIASANQMQGLTIGGRPIPDSYKNGIQWWSKGGGIQTQGNPYEVWVSQKLEPKGYLWLADYKNNWKAFDQWNQNTHDAVSDKTIDLQAKSYANNPIRVEARILANIGQMIHYQNDFGTALRSGVPPLLDVSKTSIGSYTLSLGVPSEPTEEQWEALCKAYQIGEGRVAFDSNGTRSLNFDITDIT